MAARKTNPGPPPRIGDEPATKLVPAFRVTPAQWEALKALAPRGKVSTFVRTLALAALEGA